MRLFISIQLPEVITNQLIHAQRIIKKQELLEATFVRPENMHITLEFLGQIDPVLISEIIENLRAITHPFFTAQLSLLEFDNVSHPKTLWCTIIAPELACLAVEINQALLAFKEPETRSFYGHITIARIKKLLGKQRVLAAIAALKIEKLSWPVTHFELVASQLSDQAPKYTILEQFELKKF